MALSYRIFSLVQLLVDYAFDFPTAGVDPRSRRQHKKPALQITIIRSQGRGVKRRPEGGHTPSKSSKEILPAIKLEIEPLDLPV